MISHSYTALQKGFKAFVMYKRFKYFFYNKYYGNDSIQIKKDNIKCK
jgi:hypothetical protein